MAADVAKYVARCHTCMAIKPDQNRPKGLMGKARIPNRPWQVISTDLMGPFPPSSSQHKYLLVITDSLTKFVLLFPLRTATSAAILKHLEKDVFLLFGTPERLICDNGPQYRSKEFARKMADFGVEIKFTPYYSPQCNPTERVNRTVKHMIAAYVRGNHRSWDRLLPQVQFALNSAVHESSGYTPNYLNFGRKALCQGGMHKVHQEADAVDGNEDQPLDNFGNRMSVVMEDVQERLKKAHERQGRPYNQRRRYGTFQHGEEVWKKTYPQSCAADYFSAKLEPRFQRCWIRQRISPVMYELEDGDGHSLGAWHIKDLKSTTTTSSAEEDSN